MQPITARHYLKVALRRLTAAKSIRDVLQLNLEAQYLGGYAVECALKALILEKTTIANHLQTLQNIVRIIWSI